MIGATQCLEVRFTWNAVTQFRALSERRIPISRVRSVILEYIDRKISRIPKQRNTNQLMTVRRIT